MPCQWIGRSGALRASSSVIVVNPRARIYVVKPPSGPRRRGKGELALTILSIVSWELSYPLFACAAANRDVCPEVPHETVAKTGSRRNRRDSARQKNAEEQTRVTGIPSYVRTFKAGPARHGAAALVWRSEAYRETVGAMLRACSAQTRSRLGSSRRGGPVARREDPLGQVCAINVFGSRLAEAAETQRCRHRCSPESQPRALDFCRSGAIPRSTS